MQTPCGGVFLFSSLTLLISVSEWLPKAVQKTCYPRYYVACHTLQNSSGDCMSKARFSSQSTQFFKTTQCIQLRFNLKRFLVISNANNSLTNKRQAIKMKEETTYVFLDKNW